MNGCPSIREIEAALAAGGVASESVVEHGASCEQCRDLIEDVRANLALEGKVGAATSGARRRRGELGAEEGSFEGYEIVREIHRGGQGVVYEAVQEVSERRVALKLLLQGGFATTRQRLRFEREIRIAANLRHPNIVTMLESGMDARGRMACVMDYIEGDRLDDWAASVRADAQRRPAERRRTILTVMRGVCAGVAYAHTRAIIHRDLKPANIIVDASNSPHILDFGIAKALDAAGDTRSTMTGEFIGTLAYAAPEQIRGDSEVDIRTDVYALGLILYETLTGAFPRDLEAPLPELLRRIESDEPAAPSSKSDLVDAELDAIILKAMHADPERRYASAHELGEDIERLLDGRPIMARRDSRMYVLRKTIRRRRTPIAVATVFLILLLSFAVYLYVSNMRLGERNQLIVQAMREQADLDDALLRSRLSLDDPENKQAQLAFMKEKLDAFASGIRSRYGAEPLIEAGMHAKLGDVYMQLDRFDEARQHMETALSLRRGASGADPIGTITSMKQLSELYREQGVSAEAERGAVLLEEAHDMSLAVLGPDDPVTLSLEVDLARLCLDRRELDRAATLYETALDGLSRTVGERHPDALHCLTGVALVTHERAKQLLRSADSDEQERGRAAEALAFEQFESALSRQRAVLGDGHPLTQKTMNNLAVAYVLTGDQTSMARAEPLFVGMLEQRMRQLGPAHRRTVTTMNNLGELYVDLGEFEKAEPLLRDARDGLARIRGAQDVYALNATYTLGRALEGQKRDAEAEEAFRAAIDGMRESGVTAQHARGWILGRFLAEYGDFLVRHDRFVEGERALREAYAAFEAADPRRGGDLRRTMSSLITLYARWGREDDRRAWQRELADLDA